MRKGKSYIAFLLFAVYAFSLAVSASTGFTLAGMEVKKECPNKLKLQKDEVNPFSFPFSILKNHKPGADQNHNKRVIEICTSGTSFISTSAQPEPISHRHSVHKVEPPHLYQSPHLQKRIDPPQLA